MNSKCRDHGALFLCPYKKAAKKQGHVIQLSEFSRQGQGKGQETNVHLIITAPTFFKKDFTLKIQLCKYMCAYMNAIPKKAGEVVRSPTA